MTVIDPEKVVQIYLGRDRICRCGCAGEYVQRGDPMFESRLNRFMRMAETYDFKAKEEIGLHDLTDVYANISYGKDRAMTVYFS